MRSPKYALATAELLLVFPAVLFMTALFMRNVQPQQYEPAHTAQQIVMWYAARPHLGMWLLLVTLPFIVFVTGCAILWRRWREDAELRDGMQRLVRALPPYISALLIAMATLAAGGVLGIVALHVATD